MRTATAMLALLMPGQDDGGAVRPGMTEFYRAEAEGYTIRVDGAPLELRPEPVYAWTNPVRGGGQDGAVFLWTHRGRPAALGSFYSWSMGDQRILNHEFHSLSTSVLDVDRDREGSQHWQPEAPGVEFRPIDGAPAPGGSPVVRSAQMRALAEEFSASSTDHAGRHWEFRLLPRPLYRYEGAGPEVVDGALFSFVSSAGTDPEVLLLIEAREGPDGRPAWHIATAPFTLDEYAVERRGRVVAEGPLLPFNAPQQDPQHRYRVFRDRPLDPSEAAAEQEPAP